MEALLIAELDRRMEEPAPRTTADHGIEEWEARPARPSFVLPGTPAQARAIQAPFKAEDKAMGAPLLATAPTARIAVEAAGVNVLPNGDVVRVKANKAKTRTYASRWVASKHLDRLMEAGAHEHGEYVYEQGLVAEVARVGRKMSLEEAKAHSIRYGQCVRCGRRLTDGKSVEAGMGPVCITYFQGA